jgi:hypothetical protein
MDEAAHLTDSDKPVIRFRTRGGLVTILPSQQNEFFVIRFALLCRAAGADWLLKKN